MSETSSTDLSTEKHEEPPDWRKVAKGAMVVFLPTFALALAMTVIILHVGDSAERTVRRREESHIVAVQAANIGHDIRQVPADLAMLASGTTMEKLWDDDGNPIPEILAELTQDYLNISMHQRLYDQVRLIDAGGMEIVRVDFNAGRPAVVPREKLQNKKGRYFDDAFKLDRGEVFVSPLDLNIERGEIEQPLKPMIRFATPVFDRRGVKRGIVLLNYLGAELLEYFAAQTHEPKGVLPMLLNAEGYWLLGPNPEEEWGFMYEDRKDRTFANAYPEAWERIGSQEFCQFETSQGLFTSKTVSPLIEDHKSTTGSGEASASSVTQLEAKAYSWKIVSFVPSNILYAARNKRRTVAALILTLVAIGTFFGAWRLATAIANRGRAERKREKVIVELRKALDEIKTLRGIVPICSHCKKIRDDKGAWQQVEVYVREHTEAEFSHGLCADCVRELYPQEARELLDDDENKTGDA